MDPMPRPQAIDLRIGVIAFWKFQSRCFLKFHSLHAATNCDVPRTLAPITAIYSHWRAKVQIRHDRRFKFRQDHTAELKLQIRREGPHELLPKRLCLPAKVVTWRQKRGQASRLFGQLLEQGPIDIVADTDAKHACVSRPRLNLLQKNRALGWFGE